MRARVFSAGVEDDRQEGKETRMIPGVMGQLVMECGLTMDTDNYT